MELLCIPFLLKIRTPVFIGRVATKEDKCQYSGPKNRVKVNLIRNEDGFHLSFLDKDAGYFHLTSPMKVARKAEYGNSYVIWTKSGSMYIIQ